MIAYPRLFVRFLDGRLGNQIRVASIPGALTAGLGTLQTEVMLRRDYAQKLLAKKTGYSGFEEIQNTVDKGFCLREGRYHLAFIYIKDRVRPEIYFLLVKTDKRRQELWLVTFHRIKRKQFNQHFKAKFVLREHEEEFMG
jgi:hypothetical protein